MSTLRLLVLVAILLLGLQTSYAQTKKKLTLKHATVFLKGAEITSKADLKLPAGESEIIFTNVAGNINQQSLNVGTTNGAAVQSAIFQNNYLEEIKVTARAKELEDSINYLTDIRNDIYFNQEVAVQQIKVLNDNQELYGEQKGVSVEDLQKMMDLIKARLKPLMQARTKYTNELIKVDKRIAKMKQQMDEETQKNNVPGGIILVKFYCKHPTSSTVTITYVSNNASWAPSYDLRVNRVNQPIDLTYKAHVRQNTGIEWKNISLTLSGGNPNEGTQAPGIRPWYLSVYRPQPVVSEYKVPLIDKNAPGGRRVITGEEIDKMATRNTTSMVSTSPGVYSQGDGTLYYIDGVQTNSNRGINMRESSINKYTQADIRGINTRFNIDIPYTIPSDDKVHNVAIKNYQLPATFRHYTIPKLDKDVFIQAQVTDWQEYNLLSGNTSIFFEGTYIGEGRIDMKNIEDTMYISLGRDKKVIVSRTQDKKQTTVRSIKANMEQSYTYKLDIRNTRTTAVQLVVVDQIPVSNDNDIDIKDIELSGATLEKNKGIVTWRLDLTPNDAKALQLKYTIKYPKDKRINNL